MLRRLRQERGNVTIAVMVIFLMVGLGVATYAVVDTQVAQSRHEREQESTFDLAEGALNAQTYVLGRVGTGNTTNQFPDTCPGSSNLCPDSSQVLRSYDGATQVDFKSGNNVWSTQVRDNNIVNGVPSNFYDASVNNNPHYDANGDNQLWVKASATVRGRTRQIVALIRVERRNVPFPRYAIVAGSFGTSNSGNKIIIETAGSLGVAVRCNQAPPSSCLNYDPAKGQLDPPGNYTLKYGNPTAVTADDLQALEDVAKANGTYYTSCPTNPNGAVVVVESGNCSYTDSAPAVSGQAVCCNSPTNPGVLIVKNGTLSMAGNIEFYGLIYMANQQNSSGTVFTTGGSMTVYGAVMIDGNGRMDTGSSGASGANGANVIFRGNIFDTISAIGTAGVVQNTWREIVPDTG